jgi:hypothetical protein
MLRSVHCRETADSLHTSGNDLGGRKMNDVFTYIGIRDCGCAVSIIVDRPEYTEQVKDFLCEAIDEGLHVNRVPLAEGKELIQVDCTHE